MTRQTFVARVVVCVLGGLIGVACSSEEILSQARLPGTSTSARVTLLAERGDYLDVEVATGSKSYRFFLPDSEPCRAIADGGPGLRYVQSGVFGRLLGDALECEPLGVLSLGAWRDQRPRLQTGDAIPRERAQWTLVARDAELLILRGRFPLVRHLGIRGGEDVLAVLPLDPRCEAVAGEGEGSLEFRAAGARVLSLVAHDGLCPVLGIVRATDAP